MKTKHVIITLSVLVSFITISIILGAVIFIYGMLYKLPFTDNEIRCGTNKYVIYNDVESEKLLILYNTKNEEMQAKPDGIGRGIIGSEPDFETLVSIVRNNPQNEAEDLLTFIPEHDKVTKNDIENLRQCYPASEYIYKVIDIDDVFQLNPSSWQTPESVYDQ